ncbi:MAG: class I SAM-dependent methyltransferase [Oscillospiraceae bacterium]|jgi:SAM-dependent methyltransferase|nr:class I SAM-dependent methyltransferase [Oscillospiraceae bacterium]
MDRKEILEQWRFHEKNKQARVDLWDSMAQSFGEQALPSFADNCFLRLLEKNKMFDAGSLVLDVGCGTGGYSLALAGRCKGVFGIDLSPRMIEIAKEKAEEQNTKNVRFTCADWNEMNLSDVNFEHRFDLVFAHMTPAVQSADTFLKLSQASRGWCVLAKPTRRTDPVSDKVKELVGIAEKYESSDDDILYAFELLWKQGLFPRLDYKPTQWKMEKTPSQACAMYINRMKTYRNITAEEEQQIVRYLDSITEDGVIRETVTTTVTTLYWHV